jgi:hypothetical protein
MLIGPEVFDRYGEGRATMTIVLLVLMRLLISMIPLLIFRKWKHHVRALKRAQGLKKLRGIGREVRSEATLGGGELELRSRHTGRVDEGRANHAKVRT